MTAADRALLLGLFRKALAAAMPAEVLAAHLPPRPSGGRVLVVAAGKAAATMAGALEAAWGPGEGIALTRTGHGAPTRGIEVIEAAHPVPDAAGQAAAARILAEVSALGRQDLLVFLVSGGASALMSLGLPGVTLADKAQLTRSLLASGASIAEMNCVRRHLSAVKGGRLAAAAWPARCLTLAISDVPGDAPEAIGSGPTVADPTTQAEALAILDRLGLARDGPLRQILEDPRQETPKPGDPRLARAEFRLIATAQGALEAAARGSDLPCHLLGDAIEGEAREVGRAFAGIARAVQAGKTAFAAPCVLISGGETTVTLPPGATGRGGRNVEFLMGLAAGIAGSRGIVALAADTDGIDGAAEVAGALVDGQTAERARAAGLPLEVAMDRRDGHGLFALLGDQVITGPTRTNVNDFRAILIRPKEG